MEVTTVPVVPHYPSDEPDEETVDAPDLDRIRERIVGGGDDPTPAVSL